MTNRPITIRVIHAIILVVREASFHRFCRRRAAAWSSSGHHQVVIRSSFPVYDIASRSFFFPHCLQCVFSTVHHARKSGLTAFSGILEPILTMLRRCAFLKRSLAFRNLREFLRRLLLAPSLRRRITRFGRSRRERRVRIQQVRHHPIRRKAAVQEIHHR